MDKSPGYSRRTYVELELIYKGLKLSKYSDRVEVKIGADVGRYCDKMSTYNTQTTFTIRPDGSVQLQPHSVPLHKYNIAKLFECDLELT